MQEMGEGATGWGIDGVTASLELVTEEREMNRVHGNKPSTILVQSNPSVRIILRHK
jgi:hypothetical protein